MSKAGLREMMRHSVFEEQDEVPFAQPLTRFPVAKRPALAPSFADKGEVGHGRPSAQRKTAVFVLEIWCALVARRAVLAPSGADKREGGGAAPCG